MGLSATFLVRDKRINPGLTSYIDVYDNLFIVSLIPIRSLRYAR